ncbi:MAG TPA: sialate O-acetylesterase [Tepidisphaeraceae bacterium]|jgi:sialate O-acetylesterase
MTRKILLCFGLVGLGVAVAGKSASADVVPAYVFGDNAVLQREKPIPVFGTADAGEKVSVTFAGKTADATADAEGKWRVDLPAQPANATPAEMVIKGKNTITIKNILVGEVWLASGQSNMQQMVKETFDSTIDIAGSAHFPMIRELKPEKQTAYEPMSTGTGAWKVAGPDTTGEFSAIGYHFALTLYKVLNVPVGIIDTSKGASKLRTWVDPATLKAEAMFKLDLEEDAKKIAAYPQVKAKMDADVKKWEEEKAAAAAAKTPFTKPNPGPGWAGTPGGPDDMFRPGTFYNGMIHPLLPTAMRGVIWYQGEGDAGLYDYYAKGFPAMITAWRKLFEQGDFPFYWVQLSSYGDSVSTLWPFMREAQNAALKLPNTGHAISFDLGQAQNIHPQRKQEVGRRLARVALARTYGQKIKDAGPKPDSIAREGDGYRIIFKATNGWSALTNFTNPVVGFELAGEDKVFKPATVKVEERGNSLLVTSPEVPNPVAVRYGWRDIMTLSLFDHDDGLPVEQFRSDDWKR